MKYFIYLFSIIFIVALNVAVFTPLKIHGVIPNLLLLLVVFFSLEKENQDFFFIAFFAGLFLDFYSSVFTGSFTFAFLGLGLLYYLLINNVLAFEINWKYLVGLAVAAIVLVDAFVWGYNLLVFKSGLSPYYLDFNALKNNLLFELFYDLLMIYPMYWLSHLLKLCILNLSFNQRNKIR